MKIALKVACIWMCGTMVGLAATVSGTLTDLDGKSLNGESVSITMVAPNGVTIGDSITVSNGKFSFPLPTTDPNIPADNKTVALDFARSGQITATRDGISTTGDSNFTIAVPTPDQMNAEKKSCCCCDYRRGLFHRRCR